MQNNDSLGRVEVCVEDILREIKPLSGFLSVARAALDELKRVNAALEAALADATEENDRLTAQIKSLEQQAVTVRTLSTNAGSFVRKYEAIGRAISLLVRARKELGYHESSAYCELGLEDFNILDDIDDCLRVLNATELLLKEDN